MFALTDRHTYHLYAHPTDMRKGFNGLSGLVRNELGRNPLSGDVFVFINKSRQLMKLLLWESGGYVLYTKRLEAGRFQAYQGDEQHQISWQELVFLLRGIDLKKVRKIKRFKLPKTG